jgi:hypothetical protein
VKDPEENGLTLSKIVFQHLPGKTETLEGNTSQQAV